MRNPSTANLKYLVLSLGLAFCLSSSSQAATIWRVTPSGGDTASGADWTTNASSLQHALHSAVPGDEIWVKQGTYLPTADVFDNPAPADTRTKTFTLRNAIGLYGGFSGTEMGRAQRAPSVNITILSGDLGVAGNNSDNSYHVVRGATGGLIDGFVIRDGNANGLGFDAGGGGMLDLATASVISNCLFINNSATSAGGGLVCFNSPAAASVSNCVFFSNTCTPGSGGGFFSNLISCTITNCTFSGNTSISGGGISFPGGALTVTNCILWNDAGGEIAGGPITSYSDVQGGFAGVGNINSDPQFVNSASGDFHLKSTSLCIDAANGTGAPPSDFDGNGRVKATAAPTGIGTPPYVDMGAYENQGSFGGKIIYVNADNLSPTQDGLSWGTAFNSLQSALVVAGANSEIWVASGLYKPGTLRPDTFRLKKGVALYGGFAGTETARTQRSSDPDITVLSGNLAPGIPINNSLHVVSASAGADATAVLDGFTITGGLANGPGLDGYGAGAYLDTASPHIANCVFSSNNALLGGGVSGIYSAPQIVNCSFSGNVASAGPGGGGFFVLSGPVFSGCSFTGNNSIAGGALFCQLCNSKVQNSTFQFNGSNVGGGLCSSTDLNLDISGCFFESNSATVGGGLISLATTSTTVTNCVFQSNAVTNMGGGAMLSAAPGTFMNCTFNGNSAGLLAGGVRLEGAETVSVTNCIIWGNTAAAFPELNIQLPAIGNATYSCVKGTLVSGTGNINSDPLFTSSTDLRLQVASPCINTATSAGAPAIDILGTPRPTGSCFDMGAYEFTSTPVLASGPTATPNPCMAGWAITLSAAATNADGNPVSYNWDFGDGSSATGASVTHAYATDGNYLAKVTVTNALVSNGSNSATLAVTVIPNSLIPGDSNGDGITDEIALALGADPFNPNSIPTGLSKITAPLQKLPVSKLGIKLDFTKHGNDNIALSGSILIPEGLTISDQMFVIDVGGVVKSFTLDGKGSASSGGNSIKIGLKSGKSGTPLQVAKYSIKLSKGNFAATLAAVGLVNANTTAKLNVLVTAIFNNMTCQKNVPQSYTAKKDKGGVTK